MKTLDELKQQLDEIHAQIKAMEEKEWPKEDDDFFHIWSDGSIYRDRWCDLSAQKGRLKQGNIFRTREEAEFIRDERALQAKLRKLANGWQPDWNDGNQYKYVVCFDHSSGLPYIGTYNAMQNAGVVHFKSRRDAQAALEATRDDWIKLYEVKK